MAKKMRIFVTTNFMEFDTVRRHGFDSDIAILDSPNMDTPLTIHFKRDELCVLLEQSGKFGPWGDGTSTVLNMRSFDGSIEELKKVLKSIGEVEEINY